VKNTIKFSALILIFFFTLISCKQETKTDSNSVVKIEVNEKDPLPSWNDTDTKINILAYVKDVTNSGSDNFIPISDRIATFDNDGNLWSEQPAYFQLFFAIDRVKIMAEDHPEWKDEQPFKAVLENDMKTLKELGMKDEIQEKHGETSDEALK